jgi:hypothetical protein
MIQGSQWPSFIIQGIILGADLWFIVESGSNSNVWIFLSLIGVLSLFSLQTTGIGFVYLYPVQIGQSENMRKTVGIDTWILRLLTMASLFFLYMGVLTEYPCWMKWWLIVPGATMILLIPVVFNMGISDWMREKATKEAGR